MFIIALLLQGCGIRRLEKKGIYQELEASQFMKSITTDVQVIDVRTEKEYRKSHIDGAENASYLSGNFEEIVDSLNLDPSKTTLIYCETQHRSLFAAKKLYKMGFKKIIDLDKGMIHYRKLDLPYISDSTNIE